MMPLMFSVLGAVTVAGADGRSSRSATASGRCWSVGGYGTWLSVLAASARKLTRVKLPEDVSIAGVPHVLRHSPDINRPGKAEGADMDGRGVGAVSVEAPVPAVAEKADSADVDVDAFRHIDIDVPERCQNGHRALPVVDRDVAQVEVEIPETAGSDGIPAQSEPTAPDDVAEQGRCIPGRLAARPGRRDEDIGQVFFKTRQFRANTSTQSGFNPLGEFLQSQPACEEMLTQRDDSLLAVVVRDAHGSVTHSRHARPQMACETTRGRWVKDVDISLAGGWIEVACIVHPAGEVVVSMPPVSVFANGPDSEIERLRAQLRARGARPPGR